MKNIILVSILAFGALAISGCGNGGSQLTKEESKQMDKLFKEGIKNPPNPPASSTTAQKPKVLNEPTDK